MTNRREVIVIGAGISGLTCAYRLKRLGVDAALLESSERAGGVIRSEMIDHYLIERGPNSSQGTEELLSLIEELGITGEIATGDPKAPAYVYFNEQLQAVPTGPLAFLKSRLLSARGKLRLLKEGFVPPREGETEESVASFARRRIGPEAAERLVAPFVSGIYAGDAEQLSVQAAFPRLANLESGYGSLFRGMMAKAREARLAKKSAGELMNKPALARRRLISFKRGMGFLPETIATHLGEDLMIECGQISIAADGGSQDVKSESDKFVVSFERAGSAHQLTCNNLVVAAPAWAASALVAPMSDELSRLLEEIEYPKLAIVCLAYDVSAIRTPLDGFGFLVAPGEDLNILGCVWNSSLFEGRAPEGKALLTAFIGGARHPEFAQLGDAELISIVNTDLQKALGITGPPQAIAITRYERAIPQYNLGHFARVQRIEEIVSEIPGLTLIGNYLHGVSTGDCIKEANLAAWKICRFNKTSVDVRGETGFIIQDLA